VEDWSCHESLGLSVLKLDIDIVGLPRKVDPWGFEKYFALEVIHTLFFAWGATIEVLRQHRKHISHPAVGAGWREADCALRRLPLHPLQHWPKAASAAELRKPCAPKSNVWSKRSSSQSGC
jgi:hypothetical protein